MYALGLQLYLVEPHAVNMYVILKTFKQPASHCIVNGVCTEGLIGHWEVNDGLKSIKSWPLAGQLNTFVWLVDNVGLESITKFLVIYSIWNVFYMPYVSKIFNHLQFFWTKNWLLQAFAIFQKCNNFCIICTRIWHSSKWKYFPTHDSIGPLYIQ